MKKNHLNLFHLIYTCIALLVLIIITYAGITYGLSVRSTRFLQSLVLSSTFLFNAKREYDKGNLLWFRAAVFFAIALPIFCILI